MDSEPRRRRCWSAERRRSSIGAPVAVPPCQCPHFLAPSPSGLGLFRRQHPKASLLEAVGPSPFFSLPNFPRHH